MRHHAVIIGLAAMVLMTGAVADAKEPISRKSTAAPILYLAVSSHQYSFLEVSDLAERIVREELKRVIGVEEISILGQRPYALRIRLDLERMGAFGLTAREVDEELLRNNIKVGTGLVASKARELTALSLSEMPSPEDMGKIVLKLMNGVPVRLTDVAQIEIGAGDEGTIVQFNGKRVVALGITKRGGVPPREFSAALRSALPRIWDLLPGTVDVEVAYDASGFLDPATGASWMDR